jgi:hypothetical protein
VSVFKASKPRDAKPDQAPKFSVRACFPPATDLSLLKKEAEAAAIEGFPEGVPKTLRSPFRRNDELDTPVAGIGDDWIVMTFSANQDRRPGVVDANLQDIIDDTQVYSGCWMRAQVRAFAYKQQGNKGVSFGLQNCQKLRDDEPIGKANVPASKAFTAVEGAGGNSAGSIFG